MEQLNLEGIDGYAAIDVFKTLISTDSDDESAITDSFVSAISDGPSTAAVLIKWLYEIGKPSLGRYFYKQAVTTFDCAAIDEIYEAIVDQISVSDHTAFVKYPGGRSWAKRLRSDLRNNRIPVSDRDRAILEQVSR